MIAVVVFALVACAPVRSARAPAPQVNVGVVAVPAPEASSERDRMGAALAGAPVAACFERLIQRDPAAAGEVVVRVTVDAAGFVADSVPVFATLGDDEAARCVADAVRAVQLPAPSKPALVVEYPYVFWSGATPPELARALRVKYGLEDAIPEGDPFHPKAKDVPGTYIVW